MTVIYGNMGEFQGSPIAVTAAFDSQLKSLCVKEFPCGFGTWRIPMTTISSKAMTVKSRTAPGITTTTISEPTAQHETSEDLQELAVKSPYNVDCSWSNEASTLREIAVKTPEKLTHSFILNHFKSLRIVDRKVTEVDEGLLHFQNLQQLTLSANCISQVDSKRLPKCLQELELAANQISDISSLCIGPPPLIHLGLGHNKISSIVGHMTPAAWSHLLSLDLSYNNLSDLYNTVNVLKTLPKLRNLVLQGNPLALVPGYHGYVIDSIRQLTILDDSRISADEKHYFKGLSKLREIPLDEARLTITVDVIKGLKMPPEIEDPESNLEYPKIEHKYHVEFRFLELPYAPHAPSPVPSIPTISITSPQEEENKTEIYVDKERPGEDVPDEAGVLKLNTTEAFPWAEEDIQVNYNKDFHTKRLTELRDFFRQGIEFSLVETKHSYILEDPNASMNEEKSQSAKSRPGSKMGRKKSALKREDKNKESKPKPKEGKKGKGKQEEVDLFELPRKQRLLGTCHVTLASVLDGEFEVSAECIYKTGDEGAESSGVAKHDADKKKGGKGDSSDKSNKPGQKPVESKKATRGKSAAVKAGKDEKGGKNKSKEEERTEDEVAQPPPPLATIVKLTLHRWKSAREATMAQEPQLAQES